MEGAESRSVHPLVLWEVVGGRGREKANLSSQQRERGREGGMLRLLPAVARTLLLQLLLSIRSRKQQLLAQRTSETPPDSDLLPGASSRALSRSYHNATNVGTCSPPPLPRLEPPREGRGRGAHYKARGVEVAQQDPGEAFAEEGEEGGVWSEGGE